ncbi:MAG: hypothetical protein WCP35_00865 [Verrucomicrobiota bacterium]
MAAIETLESDPRPSGCKKLVGSVHTYRLRIGDYRVVCDIHVVRWVALGKSKGEVAVAARQHRPSNPRTTQKNRNFLAERRG